jgi:hypothetical protein
MIFPATAIFVSNNDYHTVYAASSSSSSSKGGGGSASNSTSPIGSLTFLKAITKVENTKGGTSKPSDFTITVSGKSPSPKSFSGSSSGTSVTLKAGKYKVTGSGPSGYTTSYSSGCSGTASGAVPIKCTVSSSFSKTATNNSTSTTTKSKYQGPGILLILIIKASCSVTVIKQLVCPDISNHKIQVSERPTVKDRFSVVKEFIPTIGPPREDHISTSNPLCFRRIRIAVSYNIRGDLPLDSTSCTRWTVVLI